MPTDEAEPSLPPGLDLLWGRRDPGQRGPRRGRSVEEIVEAAIGVADRDGLEAVSMARVAQELGLTPMSLYRYLASKDELLQLMWNASAEGVASVVLEGDDWRSRLRSWIRLQREAIDRHPWITRMPMAAPPMAPNSLSFLEKGLEALDGTGLSDADKLGVIGLVSSYALSEARMAEDAARDARRASEAGEAIWTFEALLRELVDEESYPRLHRIAWSAVHDDGRPLSGPTEQEEYMFGVERILDGVERLIGRPSPPAARTTPASEST